VKTRVKKTANRKQNRDDRNERFFMFSSVLCPLSSVLCKRFEDEVA